MSLRVWGNETHFKHQQVPAVVARKVRKADKEQALQDAYAIVNTRDGNRCRCTGLPLDPRATEAKHRREHHHLRERNVAPELRAHPDNICLVSAEVHRLITAGWILVEGTNASKRLVFRYAEDVPQKLRIIRIASKRRSQRRESI